eukprot:269806_1
MAKKTVDLCQNGLDKIRNRADFDPGRFNVVVAKILSLRDKATNEGGDASNGGKKVTMDELLKKNNFRLDTILQSICADHHHVKQKIRDCLTNLPKESASIP